MKIQDITFFILLIILMRLKRPRLSVLTGLVCLFLAMPLFKFWIFFTAERLTWYAAAFFLHAIILLLTNYHSCDNLSRG